MRMNEFESLDDMLNYVSDNADTILKNVDYDLDDPEGMKRALELKAMQELLDEMVAEGLIKIVGKNENGDDLYQASDE
tara:strand:+ start:771 stop:1004 length:234 start_codon:yes stop_codon:yes gene_type:complete